MRSYSNRLSIVIDDTNNKKEFVIDHNKSEEQHTHVHHTSVCFIDGENNDGDDQCALQIDNLLPGGETNGLKDDDKVFEETIDQDHHKLTSPVPNSGNNLFISCNYLNPRTVLTLLDPSQKELLDPSPKGVLIRSQSMREVNAYQLLVKGWANHGSNYEEKKMVMEGISKSCLLKRTLNLDVDVETVRTTSPAAMVSIGNIKVLF